MSFGAASHYIEKKGFGRMVSKPETLEAVDRAEEAGLVHFCDNVELPVIACNCCACCCVSMANLTHYNTPAMFADSRFMPERDEAKCNACGACAKHCFSGAFHMYDKKVIFEKVTLHRLRGVRGQVQDRRAQAGAQTAGLARPRELRPDVRQHRQRVDGHGAPR